MTRCDYDAVFYRVFCVTLLAIAFTFTVILTNVFVDIDGLLAGKKEKLHDNIIPNEITTEAADNYEMNYGESDDSYRTKRSIETQSFLFHIKNPKVKNILANRLSTLLEELEAEENADMKQTPTDKKIIEDIPKVVEKPKLAEDEKKDRMLHLNMHNILLEGIERHMDLNDVYKRMFSLMSNFNEFRDKKDGPNLKPNEIGKEENKPIEDKFFDEMLNCNELQDQIVQSTTAKPAKAHPNVVIKTVIDITSIGNEKLKENDTKTSNENIQGDIELVYNGKAIKFTHSDAQPTPQKKLPFAVKPQGTSETTTKELNDYNMIPKSYMNKFVEEYFKHFPHDTKDTNNEVNRHFQTKRLKRHVRIKYEKDDAKQAKPSSKKNTEEDELYVEIETHFDSKGMKGEKKKKLIKNLIDKIQKAIHSDMTGNLATTGNRTKHHKTIHFRKRTQNPLEHSINHILLNKYSLPISNFVHRQLHPISKTVALQEESSPGIGTKSGEDWNKQSLGPGFLADTKAINSAEMSEVDVDYSKILEVNGIPQRLQRPLNTELSEETIQTNSYYDMGQNKFVIKDIDGSGFSIGFNQYVDEPPDKEYMRLFSGLENVIQSYHDTYDPASEPVSTPEAYLNSEEGMEYPKDEHTIERRSINKKDDYHSNEYKIIFNNDFLNYKNYHDIYKTKKNKPKFTLNNYRNSPLIVDENILQKNLNPSEIFSLASLFQRKKRAINVKKINDLSTRHKVNRYLNTNAMSKTIFLNTKRNKRQVNKIRIIATDLPHMSKQSDENVFVVSDENIFADRALVKEVETSDDQQKQEEYPYQNNEPETYITKIFDGRSRHNPLMSKYPHIFMEEVSRSREDYVPNNALLFGKVPGTRKTNTDVDNTDDDDIDIEQFLGSSNDTEPQKQLKAQEIVSALKGSPGNTANYKMTVKIMPKNQTGLNSGFKEIHTSINKSFNKNGLLYSSLVNVSEISKVIKLNRTLYERANNDKVYTQQEETSLSRKIQDQQEKMQSLLKTHAQHINEQLNRLNEEKMNLESMLNGNTDNITNLNSNALNASIRRLKFDSKEVVSTTTRVAPIKVHATTINIIPHEELPQSTTPPAPPTQLISFSEKVKNNNIISTIERNGNLTDQILQKIDRNTEILQMFLKKLSEKIEAVPTASLKPEIVTQDDNNTSSPDWKNQGMPFTQNMVIRKNDSHISIPFTYAYQPPTSPSVKSKTQVANVIYQGHIRNSVRRSPHAGENQVQKISEANNQSRFFIDELENEYKVVHMGALKKNREYNMVNRNNTL